MGQWLFGAGQVYAGVGRGERGEAMSTGVVDIDFDVFGMSLMLFRYPHIWLVGQIRPFE